MPSLILFPRPRAEMGKGKQQRRFSIFCARGWIDRLTLSLLLSQRVASERASAENYFAAKKE
jgi:hypothetical protein